MSDHQHHYGSFAPLFLALVTLVVWFGFQTTQLLKEKQNLATMRVNQTKLFENAQKMRTQLDALAGETAKLAQAGNPHAQQLINALKARGISIDPSKAQAAAADKAGGK
jgi:hypothetical protein